MSNFSKNLQRDFRKVNVEPKQIIKKDSLIYIENEKKRAQKMRKKQWKRSGEMKVTLGINAM